MNFLTLLRDIRDALRTLAHDAPEILQAQQQGNELLQQILAELTPPVATQINLIYTNEKGETIPMPLLMTDTQQVVATITEFDAKGAPVPVADPSKITAQSSDTSIVAPTLQADGSVLFVAGVAGTATVTVTDGSNNLTIQDTATITAGAATKLGLTFGTPTDQAPA
jgi:hypothetical protein